MNLEDYSFRTNVQTFPFTDIAYKFLKQGVKLNFISMDVTEETGAFSMAKCDIGVSNLKLNEQEEIKQRTYLAPHRDRSLLPSSTHRFQ